MEYHNPVLLRESVSGLHIKPNGIYVDVTFGGGGHSKEILDQLGVQGRLFAFDQDADARKNALDDDRFTLIPQNFKYLKRFLRFYGVKKVDGILADLGVSSHQFDEAQRGFSTRLDGRLDMRMNQNDSLTAIKVINKYSERQLGDLLFKYGELRNAKLLARRICEKRKEKRIETSFDLKEVLSELVPKKIEHKMMAQIFQGLRIEVNQEIEALKMFLMQVPEVLNKGGFLSVISYHSLEDRLVKRFIRNGMFEGEPEKDMFGRVEVPLKKVGRLIVPSAEEIKVNNRARSAKLRIATTS